MGEWAVVGLCNAAWLNMHAAEFEIRELDKSLAEDGEDIILRRVIGSTNQAFIDVTCRAFVRGYAANELIGGITQKDSRVILSPTQINRTNWPGGQVPPAPSAVNVDPRVPSKNRGDKCSIGGSFRAVEAGSGIYLDGELVRIDMRVLG